MKKIFFYILLLISLIGCSKSPGELTQERIENDLGESGLAGKVSIVERDENKDTINLKVNIVDGPSNIDSYMTYKAVDGEWVIDDFKVQFHDSRSQEHE